VIFDIVEYIIMERTMPIASVGGPNMQDMQEGCLSCRKKKSVAGQFAVKYKSETHRWTKKLNRKDYGVDQYWVLLAVVQE
jgi:hypothetical protein